MSDQKALVGVVMGSASDKEVMKECASVLKELGIPYEVKVSSAHRTPGRRGSTPRPPSDGGRRSSSPGPDGLHTWPASLQRRPCLPVIGVPIDSSPLQGMDALLSTVQMPPGIPVATVALGKGGAKNAGVLAAQILALKHPALRNP